MALLSPLAVTAERKDQSCETAQKHLAYTQQTLHSLKQQQQEIQRQVRTMYQELFACQTGTRLLTAQQQCALLQEDGPKQFQAMIKAITLSHQTSQQLAHQTHQVKNTCTAKTEDPSSAIAS